MPSTGRFTAGVAARLESQFRKMIAETMLRYVREECQSETIRDSLAWRSTPTGFKLGTPYYWARFYHDGRKAVRPRTKKFLVWFTDPDEDPRLAGGYPKSKKDRKRLNRAGFLKARILSRQDPPGAVIAKVSPRSGGTVPGHPFLLRGIQKARLELGAVARTFLRGETRRMIRRGRDRIYVRF